MVTMVKMHLMLVDDEERFLETMKKLLERRGYSVITATSGEEGLKKLGEELVHVVILDVKMPGIDGLETLRRIKQKFPMTEVIMLTGHGTIESAVDGLKAGATDYLMKPAEIEEIVAKAEKAFQRRVDLEQKINLAEAMKKSSI